MLKGLICNSSLETLMMNNMELTNKSLRIFETTLGINTTLKKLFLERNKINYKGWRLLSEILNKNKYIEYISLVGNNFENQHRPIDVFYYLEKLVGLKRVTSLYITIYKKCNNIFKSFYIKKVYNNHICRKSLSSLTWMVRSI